MEAGLPMIVVRCWDGLDALTGAASLDFVVARGLGAVVVLVGLVFVAGCERVATSSPRTSASAQPTVEVSDPRSRDTAATIWQAVLDIGDGVGRQDCRLARQRFDALPTKQRRDAWGYEMVVYCDAHDWSVASRGADGRLATADDLAMESESVLAVIECGLEHN